MTSPHPAPAPSNGAPDFPIAIIGAGFAGIGMAIQLKQAGILSFTIFERAGEIGGTWRDNTYPGAACDVPSHVYSYSFEPNPDWSHTFSESAEIQRYLLRCVEKHRLRPHLRLDTAITAAAFDEAAGRWTLTTSTGERVSARLVVSAVGGLVDPACPDIAGLTEFTGALFHTARWDHGYDLTGKRVAVIGTGASAIQVVPAIAPRVGTLSVFQRTPAWVVPRRDREIGPRTRRFFRRYPLAQRIVRALFFWLSEAMGPIIVLDSPRLSRIGERASLRHLRRSVADPELRRKLTPTFQFGCKRMLISDDYWSTFTRENVELVTEGIREVRPASIVTNDGRERPVDAIVLATGFAVGLAAAPFPIAGLGGRPLAEAWKDGAVAYKGMTVAGFPNWFIIMGPNTGPGHTSVLVYSESQIGYILQAIRTMIAEDLRYVSVKREVQDRYNAGIQGRMKHTSWSSGCNSWYLGADGTNRALYPGFATEYRLRVRRFKVGEYDVGRPHFNGGSSGPARARATSNVPPTTASGSAKLDTKGMA
jgi:cation diffusion facilitator CzcD-associated flavoprotein CzcO